MSSDPQTPDRRFVSLDRDLVVASNRLPVVLERDDGGWSVKPGSGGLVTSMAPILDRRGGTWVGWPGTTGETDDLLDPLHEASERAGYELVPVPLTAEERDNYYYGFANEVLWPLLHDLQTRYRWDPDYWDAYRRVNRHFAEVLARTADADDYIWVHDYHLLNVGRELADLGHGAPRGHFLHTPFPSLDIFEKLPWRTQILEGLLHFDLLGLQTRRDRDNFLECLGHFFPSASFEGSGSVVACRLNGRELRVAVLPIGIDARAFEEMAASEEVAEARSQVTANLPDRELILGVDRLDYTKGIPNRLEAFATALARFPDLRGRVSLVQVVVPSREHIPQYSGLRTEIERMVGQINGRFARAGWVPVHYLYRSLERPALVAHYRNAAVALVTPLKDGMNLVAKEYCASNLDENGVLVLSEFAGAADQLGEGALLVNPYDVVGTAEALRRAVLMDLPERQRRMRRLREIVRRQDIYWWLEGFLGAALAESLPSLELPSSSRGAGDSEAGAT